MLIEVTALYNWHSEFDTRPVAVEHSAFSQSPKFRFSDVSLFSD